MSFFSENNNCQSASNPLNKVIATSDHDLLISHNELQRLNAEQRTGMHTFQNIDMSTKKEFDMFTTNIAQPISQPKNDFFIHSPEKQIILGHQQNDSFIQNNWSSEFRLSANNIPYLEQNQFETPINSQNINSIPSQPFYIKSGLIHNPSLNLATKINYDIENSNQHKNKQTTESETNNDFESMFIDIETELLPDQENQNQKNIEEEELKKKADEDEKIKFAILAQNVFNSMNNTPRNISSNTSNKFKQSGFMQLMNKISNREIEISSDKMKLVDEKGNDIRSVVVDPLSNLGLSDNLESSFNSALKISQNVPVKVDINSWQGDFS